MEQRMVVTTIKPPEPKTIKWHLTGELRVSDEELDAALAEGMPALALYNERHAQVIRWHYGLDGNTPRSVDEIRQKLGGISATSVRRAHDAGFLFLRHYYLRREERVTRCGVLPLRVPCFFRLRRFLDQLDDTPLHGRLGVARRMQRAVFKQCPGSEDGSMATLLVYWGKRSRTEMKKKIGRRTFVVFEAILTAADITVQWDTTGVEKSSRRSPKRRLRLVASR
ncbi:MAG TPA: hypothetical protein VG102_00375 [Candidatus Paceibacterota bacterium]|nr:hypothetical protein [Candidatus Paceibacterota bacterium]